MGEGAGQTHPSVSGQPAERKTRASEGVRVRVRVGESGGEGVKVKPTFRCSFLYL